MNLWQKDLRLCCKYNIEDAGDYFSLKLECVVEKIKSLNVKLIYYKTAFE